MNHLKLATKTNIFCFSKVSLLKRLVSEFLISKLKIN